MKLPAATVFGIIKHIEQSIVFDTVGLLRESGEESAKDMFFFKVFEYGWLQTTKVKPDHQLKFFDFDGYTRDWVSPAKKSIIDSTGNITLSEIAKNSMSRLILPENSQKVLSECIDKALSNSGSNNCIFEFSCDFFEIIQSDKFDAESKKAIISFMDFGKKIMQNPKNKMDVEQTAKMMAPCFVTPIYGIDCPADELRKGSALFQSMLELCYRYPDELYSKMLQGVLREKPKKKFSLQRLFKNSSPHKTRTHSTDEIDVPADPGGQRSFPKDEMIPMDDSLSSTSSVSPLDLADILDDSEPAVIPRFERLSLSQDRSSYSASQIVDLVRKNKIKELSAFLNALDNPSEYINTTRFIFGRSLLHEAVLAQNPEAIRLLRSLGASILVFDHRNFTPLHVAANWPKTLRESTSPFCGESLQALFEFDDAYLAAKLRKDDSGDSPLKLAKQNGIFEDYQRLRIPLNHKSKRPSL